MNDLQQLISQIVETVRRIIAARRFAPVATYRLQFNSGFTFRDAAAMVDYLHALGASDVYASPYLKARPGSPHGYDICDHTLLNPELGTRDDYEALVGRLREHGMSHLLDMVPNHMGVATNENRWWNDVLENGASSPYARYFDIDWQPVKEELRNKVLLPMLGTQYGEALESQQLQLELRDGALYLRYFDSRFPLDPRTYPAVLTDRMDALREALGAESIDLQEYESIVRAAELLPPRSDTRAEQVAERQREKEVVKRRLARLIDECEPIRAFVTENLRRFNGQPGEPRSFDPLDELLMQQAFRLSSWKAASDEINYRRFFDINDLAAVCTEDPVVFHDTHRLVMDLLVDGHVLGLRIDHIDGLYDPEEYLWRLQWDYVRSLAHAVWQASEAARGHAAPGAEAHSRAASALASAAAGPRGDAAASLAEEPPPSWDELEPLVLAELKADVGGAMPTLAPLGKEPGAGRDEPWRSVGQSVQIPDDDEPAGPPPPRPLYVAVEKILGPDEPLPAEWPCAGTTGYDALNSLNGLFVDPAGLRQVTRLYDRFIGERVDFGKVVYRAKALILRVAMASELQMLAHRLNRMSEQRRESRDFTLNQLRHALREILACFPVYRTYIGSGGICERDRQFVNLAVAQAKRRNPAIDAALFDFIRNTLLLEGATEEAERAELETFVGRFQQVTSPVMAKGMEDTAFYAYFPLVSLNEVGGEPREGPVSLGRFHHDNLERAEQRPRSLVCATTHDTKRSEDVRARINVLSEVPSLWRAAVNRWARLNKRFCRDVEGAPAPNRQDEYLFYQSLIGIWPLTPPCPDELPRLIERLQTYMAKATHEAKEVTSWVNPNPAYDAAVADFVSAVLQPRAGNKFLESVRELHQRIVGWGLYTALSQTLLKLTVPGVPDVYQGQELWDFSLVDPDNRRPVNFDERRHLLGEVHKAAGSSQALLEMARRLGRNIVDNRAKLLVTWRTLQARRDHTKLFMRGNYQPLETIGPRAEHVVSFARRLDGAAGDGPAAAIIVAPRLLARLTPLGADGLAPPPLGSDVWADTAIELGDLAGTPLQNVFTGQRIDAAPAQLKLAEALADFPVALLIAQP